MSLYIYNNIIIMVIYHYSRSIWFSESEQLLTCCFVVVCMSVSVSVHTYMIIYGILHRKVCKIVASIRDTFV